MPLDPSIILSGVAPQDPLTRFAKIQALQNGLQQQQLGQQQLQEGQISLQQKQQAMAAQKTLDDVMSTAFTRSPDGNLTVNKDAVAQQLGARGQGHLIPGVLKNFNDMDEAAAKTKKAQVEAKTAGDDYTAQSLLTIADSKYDPSIAIGAIAHAQAAGVLPPAQAVQITSAIQQNPTAQNVQALIEPLLSKSPAYQKLVDSRKTAEGSLERGDAAAQKQINEAPGQQADAAQKVRTNTASQLAAAFQQGGPDAFQAALGKLPYAAAQQFAGAKSPADILRIGQTPEQTVQSDATSARDAQTKKYQDQELVNSAAKLGIERQRLFADTEETKLTPEARDKMAEMFATTGQLPPLGMGKAASAVRSQIINRAAEQFPSVQFATNKAAYQANSSSLKKAQTNLDTVDAAEKTAGKNLQVFLDSAQKVVDSGSPLLNKPLRLIDQQLLGSPEMAAFKAARTTAIAEVSRVLNNPNGSAAVSDSARHEVEGLIGPDATMNQIVAAAKILKTDMTNRHQSYQEQVDAIGKRITSGGTGTAETPGQPATPAKPAKRFNPKTGQIEANN